MQFTFNSLSCTTSRLILCVGGNQIGGQIIQLSKSQVTSERMNRCSEQKWWRISCEEINMVRFIKFFDGNRCLVIQMLKAVFVDVQTKHGWVVQISTTEPLKFFFSEIGELFSFRCLTTIKCLRDLCFLISRRINEWDKYNTQPKSRIQNFFRQKKT